LAIPASPNGLFNDLGPIGVNAASEVGFIVTLTIAGGIGLLLAGDQIIVAGVGAGYNGTWTITQVNAATGTLQYIATTSGLAPLGAGGTITTSQTRVQVNPTGSFIVGQSVTIAGAGIAGYNGTWTVRKINGGLSFVVFVTTAGLANSGNGTVSAAGNIVAGVHKISVVFVTRQGYITAPAPPASWTAAGGKRVIVSNIPTGPPNVISRILIFTLAGQTSVFYTKGISGIFGSNFVIQDNTTTSVTVDFTDVGLAAGINADSLFRLEELGECSGVIDYGSRLFWWGERNKLENVNNLTFDGGFIGSVPSGWTLDATNGAGGSSAVAGGLSVVWGDAYAITGNGATATRGLITESMFQDSNAVPILLPNIAYSVRARIARNSTLAAGTLHINLSGFIGQGIAVTAAQATTSYQEFIAALLPAQTSIPSSIVLQVYADGTPTNNGVFLIDCIEIYPTNQPSNASLVRASLVEDPESYDGVTGFLNVNENDGFAVRSAFVIRENLYFVKEHGIYVTQDDGINEPSKWSITEVSRKVGTPSVNGVAVGEDWAVIADRTGLYITTGGEPKKISQEIQPTWDRINWAAGQTLWVQVDLQNKRIYVGVPLDGATSPNTILMMDYRGIDTAEEIAGANAVHTSYSGKLLVLEKSRKWAPWTIAANSGAIVERFDGTQQMFLGNGAGTGKIYQLSDSQFTDDGAAIPDSYTTYFHFSHDLEQAFQIGSHNKLYTYLSMFVEGSGQLAIFSIPPGNAGTTQIGSIPLANPAVRDIEFPINVTAVRAAFKISTANSGDWFRLARFIVNAIKHPSAPVRGWN
jgi:hypothetical protein